MNVNDYSMLMIPYLRLCKIQNYVYKKHAFNYKHIIDFLCDSGALSL